MTKNEPDACRPTLATLLFAAVLLIGFQGLIASSLTTTQIQGRGCDPLIARRDTQIVRKKTQA